MKKLIFLLAFLGLTSCAFMHDDEVVAKVEGKKLYKREVLRFIPPGVSSSDSIELAHRYINAWAGEIVLNSMASRQLSKEEMDISKEVEEYRNALIKYRYEQHYIEDRIDTVVTADQVKEHYETNPSLYKLGVPILKARFLRIPVTSPLKDQMLRFLASNDDDEIAQLDSLARMSAGKYSDFGGDWVDIVTLAHEYGMDYGTLIASRKKSLIDIEDEQGIKYVTYVMDYIPAGKIPPIEYCEDKIKDVIISQRRYLLSSTLEQELLEDAKEKGTFIIYDENEK